MIGDIGFVGVYVVVIEFFGIDDFICSGFDEGWFCEKDCFLFLYNDCFIGYGRYICVISCV